MSILKVFAPKCMLFLVGFMEWMVDSVTKHEVLCYRFLCDIWRIWSFHASKSKLVLEGDRLIFKTAHLFDG